MEKKSINEIIIVGGSGSIGAVMIRKLHEHFSFFIIDKSRSTSNDQFVKERYCCDLVDTRDLDSISKKMKGDFHVVYLAGFQDNDSSTSGLKKSFEGNILALENFFLACKDQIGWFTYFSTVSVYGPTKSLPICLSAPLLPETPYGVYKATAEVLIRGLCHIWKIPLTVFRVAQLYGIESAKGCLPHVLLRKLSAGEKIRMTCDRNLQRDFLHVDDVISLMKAQLSFPKSGIFNVGYGKPYAVQDIFQVSLRRFGKDTDLSDIMQKSHVADQQKATFHQWLDITKTQDIFGFRPKINLLEWMRTTPIINP